MSGFVEMHVDEMKEFVPSTPRQLREVQFEATEAAMKANRICEVTREQFYFALIKEIVEKHYDVGTVESVYQIFGGYINMTFGIYTMKDGERTTWLFRKYKRGKELDALLFEHRLLTHARTHGFSFGASPIQTRDNKTYHEEMLLTEDGQEPFFFAIFNYIDGARRYDWIPNWAEDGLQESTLTSAARCMAEFHSSTIDFDPEGLHGDNIMDNEDSPANDLIAKYPETLKKYRAVYEQAGLENPYIEFFDAIWEEYRAVCEANTIPPEDYERMVVCPCHCDFHPGNFKYYDDGTISGSFDYDMAKFDSRLFEIGLAMHYCFASWKLASDGVMDLDRVRRFITCYNEEVANIGTVPPLNETEKKYLYEVIVQGTVYVYGWCTSAVMYDTSLDPFEYLYYSQHFARCLTWLQQNEQAIRAIANDL